MANTTKNTASSKKATTKAEPKTTSKGTSESKPVNKDVEDSKVKELENIVATQNKQMTEMMEQMKLMQQQMAEAKTAVTSTPTVTLVQDKGLQAKKIKVISCVHCWLNLTTDPQGSGKEYTFPNFGYSQNIKYDDLEKCVHNHRNSAERGDFYICDPEAVADLGLSDEYQNLYNADELNDIAHFTNGVDDVDKIIGLAMVDSYTGEYINTSLRDNLVQSIAENIAKGEDYDWNCINKLQEKTGINITELIDNAKAVILKENDK